MPEAIRESIFETNSSSSHAVAVKGGQYEPDAWELKPDGEGVVRIYPGEFGWGVETYHDAAAKASYLMTWLAHPPVDKDMAARLRLDVETVIRELTGAKFVRYCKSSDEYNPDGYIDHQSLEDGAESPGGEVLFAGRQAICDFIFNPKSFLVIDNDNH